MIRKYTRRYHRWQENVRLTSWFVIFCGLVATAYFFYRIVLVVSPAVVIEQNVFNPKAATNIVCGEDEGNTLKDPEPILSSSYQKRIHQQRALSDNLVTNPDLSETNTETDEPTGYSHSVENDDAQYVYTEDTDGTKFLRATAKKAPEGSTPPAWQIDPVQVQGDRTYAYSFWYRSDVPVQISTEYTAGGKTYYGDVTTLQATSSWQQFAAHFDNDKDAGSFRVDLSGTKAGHVDTRLFDIHRIADAHPAKGLVTVAFDDGWQSVNDKALALLSAHHIRTTQYIISDVAGNAVPEYMSMNTVKKLHAAGHEIGSHTLTHCNQTQLNASQLQENAIKSKQMLENQGLGPVKSFAYPLGQYNGKTQAVYEKYYPLIRSSDFGYNDRYFDETDIHSIGVLNTTSDKEFKSWLSWAKAHRLWVVLVYHRVDASGEYSVTSAQLERQLKMINDSGLNVLPLSEAAAAVRK